ncbi:MAG TPA: hypothetical protein PKV73_01050 [Agriterribacter sp.]|nr:hypothetical protein [Agriterribacter sp.]
MATVLPISEIIEIGNVSIYLSANYTAKRGLFGGSLIKPVPPVQIAWVTSALSWGYSGGAQTEQSLRETGNYAYWLYGLFQLQAQNIISGPGGGSVVPTPSGGGSPNDLDFIVSASSLIPTGGTSLYIPQFIGYQVDFARGGIMQYTTPQPGGGTYYSWDSVTGIFTLLSTDPVLYPPNATEGEPFRIMVDAGGSGSAAATDVFPFVVTSADFEPDGVTLLDTRISGNTVYLQANNVPNPFLFAPDDFIYVSGGVEIIVPGFNANTFSYTIVVNKLV